VNLSLTPSRTPERYENLRPGDLAVFGLEGEAVPTAMTLVLLSQNDVADATPYTALNTALGNRPMSVLTADALAEVVAKAALDRLARTPTWRSHSKVLPSATCAR
jgi:hypothetical protein